MNNRIFIDTNILVYAYDNTNDIKHKRAKSILFSQDNEKYDYYISTQILNEFYSVIARKKVKHSIIVKYLIEIIDNTHVVPLLLENTMIALNIKDKYRFAWYDSIVLATAVQNRCNILYSEDFQHNQIIEGVVKIINPLIIDD